MQSNTKTDDYRAIYRLNRHFDALGGDIDRLQASGLLAAHSAEARKASLDEVRARTNSAIVRA